MLLGRRNHFTIYNALPAQMRCNDNEDENENCLRNVALNLTQTSQNSQNGKSLRPCTSGVSTEGSQPTYTKLSTLNSQQELSHADCTDYTEDSCLAGNINLTQNTQNSQKASRYALAALHRGFFLSHADLTDFTEAASQGVLAVCRLAECILHGWMSSLSLSFSFYKITKNP